MYKLLIIPILFFTACDYSETSTTSTQINDNSISKTLNTEKSVVLNGKEIKLKKESSFETDGTINGTKANLDYNILSPEFKQDINNNLEIVKDKIKKDYVNLSEKISNIKENLIKKANLK